MSNVQAMSHWPSWPLPVRPGEIRATGKQVCGYLPERMSTFRAFEVDGAISGEAYQKLLDAGFRRSGGIIYQPMCTGCRACIPLRVAVADFRATKSQRRVQRKNKDIVVRAGHPVATAEKWELYDRYQREWHKHKAADAEEVMEFVTFLYRSPVEAVEFEYRDTWGKLLGVGIGDLCPTSLSSVYFYFDPHEARRSLGTFSAMYEIQWAKEMQLKHWYAGYWIKQCAAMSYKSRFGPGEVLGTDGIWRPLEEPTAQQNP